MGDVAQAWQAQWLGRRKASIAVDPEKDERRVLCIDGWNYSERWKKAKERTGC